MDDLRAACAQVASDAHWVQIRTEAAADIDQLLWDRGGGARYKASPRHRCRCTAY